MSAAKDGEQMDILHEIYSLDAYKVKIGIYSGEPMEEPKHDLVIVNQMDPENQTLIESQRSAEFMRIQIYQNDIDRY